MELNEKLQQLRKQKGLTQEELAEALFVSRTAVSKWESGRGYPSIDSLRAIAKFYDVSVDELLSGEQLLSVAESHTAQKQRRTRDLVFGLMDVAVAMLLFLPFFGQAADGAVKGVSLMQLSDVAVYLKGAYYAAVIAIIGLGVLTLALQNWENDIWQRCKGSASIVFSIVGVLLFVLSRQPYPATFLLVILAVKVLVSRR